ncbi:2OG-Fe(II) oxygenase family protein [Alteromonas stellipolaris]|uniref:2OG-Fe(II) oxygenase family protein n=1 Tax=Alteromonas stellipolaris TaxID=233316 RepID=UPI002495695D|nr:tetratricopeptide repeat protein [Alteromonas stellipolaris]
MTNPSPAILIPQLINAYKRGDYSYVVSTLENSPALVNADGVVPQLLGTSLRRIGQDEKALKVFERGIKKFPIHPDLCNSFGNFLLEKAQPEKAILLYRRSLKVKPKHLDYEYNLARALAAAHKYKEAEILFNDLIVKRPENINVQLAYATLLDEQEDVVGAEKALKKILATNPQHPSALNNLGNIQRKNGNFDKAAKSYRAALNSGITNATLYRNLASCLILQKEYESGMSIFEKGATEFPLDVQLQKEFAHFLWTQNHSSPFLFIENSMTLNTPALVLLFCELNLQVERFEVARHWLEKLLFNNSNTSSRKDIHLAAVPLYSQVLRASNEFQAAIEICNKYHKLYKRTPLPFLVEKGYSYLGLRDGRNAEDIFAQCCKIAPENQGFWTMLSTAQRLNGNQKAYTDLCNYETMVSATVLFENDESGIDSANLIAHLQPYLQDLHKSKQHPIGQSLRNGSQTFEDLFSDPNEFVQLLREQILARVSAFISSRSPSNKHPFLSRLSNEFEFKGSWSVRLVSTGFHKSHYHSDGWLSGVFYVDVPKEVEQGGNGWLLFGKPDIQGLSMIEDYAIKPEPGLLALFPSYMWHGTNPITSNQQRLTVAFDIIPVK